MFITSERLNQCVIELVNDLSIDDDLFESKYQHVRDDMCLYAGMGGIESNKMGMHKNAILNLLKKYDL